MTIREATCIIAFVLLVVLGAGCLGKPPASLTPTPTPTPTATSVTTETTVQTPVTPVPTTVNPMEPQPTDFVPNGLTTSITVSRNPSTYQPSIIVVYNGGTGQGALQQLEVIVTHPDGSVQTDMIVRPPDGSIHTQTTITIPQSVNEQVRVQVIATYAGVGYSVYDQLVGPA
jgi:hypothetical protein